MEQAKPNVYFLALLREHELRGLLGLGKIADPATGEPKVNLEMTSLTIGILEMLEEKTRGSLVEMETHELSRVLTSLRLNYVDEAGKATSGDGGTGDSEAASGNGGTGDSEAASGNGGATADRSEAAAEDADAGEDSPNASGPAETGEEDDRDKT